MNWLKIVTRKGRQAIAREILRENLTPEAAASCGARLVNNLLGRIRDKERLGAVAVNLEKAGNLVAACSRAVQDGEVSVEEATVVTVGTTDLLSTTVTQERVDALIEYAVAKIP